jgi:hypothetical protein
MTAEEHVLAFAAPRALREPGRRKKVNTGAGRTDNVKSIIHNILYQETGAAFYQFQISGRLAVRPCLMPLAPASYFNKIASAWPFASLFI